MNRRPLLALTLLLASVLAANPAVGDDVATADTGPSERVDDENDRLLPLFREWFEEQGVPLPLPLGAGLMMIFMERDIEVREVTVQFMDRPPESISDRVDFEVGNRTRSTAARFDAWVLPFVNVYALAGRAYTDTSLRTRFAIDRPNGEPIEVEIGEDTSVDGPMLGLGLTAVIGGDGRSGVGPAKRKLYG